MHEIKGNMGNLHVLEVVQSFEGVVGDSIDLVVGQVPNQNMIQNYLIQCKSRVDTKCIRLGEFLQDLQVVESPEVPGIDPGDAVVPQEDVLQLIQSGERGGGRGGGRRIADLERYILQTVDVVVLQVEQPQLAAVAQVRQATQLVALQLPDERYRKGNRLNISLTTFVHVLQR